MRTTSRRSWRRLAAAALLLPFGAGSAFADCARAVDISALDGEPSPTVIARYLGAGVAAGIDVRFTLPGTGPSGVFVNGLQQLSVTTDAQGIAIAPILRRVGPLGLCPVSVTALHDGQRVARVFAWPTDPWPTRSAEPEPTPDRVGPAVEPTRHPRRATPGRNATVAARPFPWRATLLLGVAAYVVYDQARKAGEPVAASPARRPSHVGRVSVGFAFGTR